MHICKSAFEDVEDNMCVPRQIAEVTRESFETVCDRLDECGTKVWREEGATGKTIFEYSKRYGYGCCCLHGEKVIETLLGKNPLCFTTLENHAYFYEDRHIRRRLAQRKECDFIQIKRDFKESKTPDFSQWLPYTEAVPGHFHVPEDHVENVRSDFLAKGQHPKCVMKDEQRIKTLI